MINGKGGEKRLGTDKTAKEKQKQNQVRNNQNTKEKRQRGK